MEFLALLGINAASVLALVVLLQLIKKPIRKKLPDAKKKTLDKIWIVAVAIGGIVIAFVNEAARGFSTFNLWLFIQSSFAYAAGASFVYMIRKTILPPAVQDDAPDDDVEIPPAPSQDGTSGVPTPPSG